MGKHSKHGKPPGQKTQSAQPAAKKEINFERRLHANGEVNSKYIDLLDVDPPIAGQSYCLLSFLSPEKILKQKEMFYFAAFLKKWDFAK